MGCNNAGASDELWVFSTTRKEWALLSTTTGGGERPSARDDHAMTAVGSDIYLHGGDTDKYSDNGESRDRVRRGGWLYVWVDESTQSLMCLECDARLILSLIVL